MDSDPARVASRLFARIRDDYGLDPDIASETSPTEWHQVARLLHRAETSNDLRMHAAAEAMLFVLRCRIAIENAASLKMAGAAKAASSLADSVRGWRNTPALTSIVSEIVDQHRKLAGVVYARAASTADECIQHAKWTAWLAAAIRNPWLKSPHVLGAALASRQPQWWQWTAWLAGAMKARMPEFPTHDLPELIELAAASAAVFDEIAAVLGDRLYFPKSAEMVGSPRRGRPIDHMRRELDAILRPEFASHEIAEILEDPVSSKAADPSATKVERLRGRRRRGPKRANVETAKR